MTQYYPGPWEVEIFYVEGGITHKQRLNCEILTTGASGDPFTAFTVNTKANTAIALNTAVDAYVALLKPLLATTTNITIGNLYQYLPDSYDKTFRSTYDINQIGTSAGAYNPNHQTMMTFTSALGNPFKWTILDDPATNQLRVPIRDATAPFQNMANYLVGNTSWIIARDGSFPVGKLNIVGGQNEALFKRRNR